METISKFDQQKNEPICEYERRLHEELLRYDSINDALHQAPEMTTRLINHIPNLIAEFDSLHQDEQGDEPCNISGAHLFDRRQNESIGSYMKRLHGELLRYDSINDALHQAPEMTVRLINHIPKLIAETQRLKIAKISNL